MTLAEMLIASGEIIPDYNSPETSSSISDEVVGMIRDEVISTINDFSCDEFEQDDGAVPDNDKERINSIPYPEDLSDDISMETFKFLKESLTYLGITSGLNEIRRMKGLPLVEYHY